EEVVEQGVLGAGVVVAVPPEPVAALGDVNFLPGLLQPVGGHQPLPGPLPQVLPGPVQGVPGGVVLLLGDPDGEVVPDPATGEQPREGVPGRVLFQEVAALHRADLGALAAALVEGAQEDHAAVGVVLPAVLAVEDDADQGGRPAPADGPAD